MKSKDTYEIDLTHLWALCLIHWKKIVCASVACGFLILISVFFSFQAPSENTKLYRDIEKAIQDRRETETAIASAHKSMEENLYYQMDPDAIVTKRLTILIELENKTELTDQLDPSDVILYAYHNLARSELRGDVLVPSVLTKDQQEQLFGITSDSAQNLITISMTADDRELVDNVLAITAQWYQDQQEMVAAQTQAHKLTVLPLTETVYDQASRAAMVSSKDDLAKIRTLEDSIQEYNTMLDELFQKSEDWALVQSVEQLQEAFQKKVAAESKPALGTSFVIGILLGSIGSVLYICIRVIAGMKLLGEQGIESFVGWKYIGRLGVIAESKDPLVRYGYQILYNNIGMKPQALAREVRGMTDILLQDRGTYGAVTFGLVGNVPLKDMQKVAVCLHNSERKFAAASLKEDRVAVNRLCRSADVIIFVCDAEDISSKDVIALYDILQPLNKTPLGYVLV